MNQLDLFALADLGQAQVAQEPLRFFTGGLPRRDGTERYVHLFRADDDPARSPRNGETKRWRSIDDHTPSEWLHAIEELLSDGTPRTFNRLLIELVDLPSSVGFETHADEGLWLGVAQQRLCHTLQAPVLFALVDHLADGPQSEDA